jgi:glucosamine-phosphate N-acetyltransferase
MSAFTPDSKLDLLFDADIIPHDVRAALPEELHVSPLRRLCLSHRRTHRFLQIRPLALTDYHRSHLSVLAVLTVVPDPGQAAWEAQFTRMRALPQTYYTIVIIYKPTDQIIAVGTVFIEYKFLRGLGSVGHIEDIAVDKKKQGMKLGLRIIQALTGISEKAGVYKTILNCSKDNVREYLTFGYCFSKLAD